jgi:ankyrin repeat protein
MLNGIEILSRPALLTLLCNHRKYDLLEALLKAKPYPANPNRCNPITGEIPLTIAAKQGDTSAVSILLNAHANPNLANVKTGETPSLWQVIEDTQQR